MQTMRAGFCRSLGFLAGTVCLLLQTAALKAQDSRPLRELIDEQISAGWTANNIQPAELADDAEFLRRVTLDLTGSVPTAQAAKTFLDDPSPTKRETMIDSLLASSGYARHMASVFDVMLLERQYGNYVTDAEWIEYLQTACSENRPWDKMARELVGSDGSDPATRPAMKFFTVRTLDSYRVLNPHALTRDIGRLLLGVNYQCNQCHDHPSISEYHQADYYGIYAFVHRTNFIEIKVQDKPLHMITEKTEGDASFSSVFDEMPQAMTAQPRLPQGPEFPDPKLPAEELYKVKPAENVLPVPNYSPRKHLVESLTAADNQQFKRNIANRLWQHMLGRGIVHPPDLHHADNPPSHPALLTLLADRFAASGFDIKAFLREVALSKTYQLSSTPRDRANVPAPQHFAAAPLRLMRPEQLALAMLQATEEVEAERLALGEKATEKSLHERLSGTVKQFVELYGRPPGQPENQYDSTLFQALFVSNGDYTTSWLNPRPGNLGERLSKVIEPTAVAEELYLSMFARKPNVEETAIVTAHLTGRDTDRAQAIKELAWAMLASVEFRFNH